MWPAVTALVVGSVIGLFYYLRVIVAMLAPVSERTSSDTVTMPQPAGAALAALMALMFWLGVYPAPLIDLLRATVRQFGG
jgi:NADH-quinone oxidoreductase subunit N